MQNHKAQDSLYVNTIAPPNDIKHVSNKPVGNAAKDPFCVYAHKRHAVGSKMINRDGSEAVCTEDGVWHNS